MSGQLKSVISVALMLTAGSVLADVINGINIGFENIGNYGNAADTDLDPQRNGYGAVGYNYGISTTEISVGQFTPSGLGSGSGDMPAVNMTWHVAAQYANWLTTSNVNVGAYTISAGLVTGIDRSYRNADGKLYVLPTEDEWYKAAYFTGSGYSLYANGTELFPDAGVDANYNGNMSWTVGSGTIEQNDTFDMMGNVWEWTESAFDGTLDSIGEDISLRGGNYADSKIWLRSSERGSFDPSTESPAVGLRIVAIPEPVALGLISTCGATMLFVRRKFLD